MRSPLYSLCCWTDKVSTIPSFPPLPSFIPSPLLPFAPSPFTPFCAHNSLFFLAVLPDGSRLVHWDHYNYLRQSFSEQQLNELKVFKISPNFRVIATGSLPNEKKDYITSEIASMFAFHVLPELPFTELVELLHRLSPDTPVPVLKKIVEFSRRFNENKEFQQTPFTVRHCIRCAKQVSLNINKKYYKNGNLYQAIQNQIVPQYVSKYARKIVEEILKSIEVTPEKRLSAVSEAVSGSVYPFLEHIGDVAPENIHLVPKILYFENERHENMLAEMSAAFRAGEHLLLIGNQGTGTCKKKTFSFPYFFYPMSFTPSPLHLFTSLPPSLLHSFIHPFTP